MKIKIDNYSFDKTAKTVTFTDYATIRLDAILIVTNVTVSPHVIIYLFAPPIDGVTVKGGTVSGNVLTLQYDTTAMSNTDKLQIFYQDESIIPLPTGAATQTTLAAVLAKILTTPATEAKQDTLIAKDYATQTTLADILAKIITAPATETTIAAILAKIIAAPSTEAKQDTLIAKIITSPATEAKQDTSITLLSAPATVINGKKLVTTAGTRVTLASSTTVKSVTIKALSTNTGFIYVGDSSVASTNGFQLLAGETVSMDIANLSTINIDSSVNGEGVSFIAIN